MAYVNSGQSIIATSAVVFAVFIRITKIASGLKTGICMEYVGRTEIGDYSIIWNRNIVIRFPCRGF